MSDSEDLNPGDVIGLPRMAKRLGVSYETARVWCVTHRIEGVFQYDGRGPWRCRVADIDKFICSQQDRQAERESA